MAGSLAGCGPRGLGSVPAVSQSSAGVRAATAGDYRWFEADGDLAKGFCFTWVKGLNPQQVIKRLGGRELERVDWQQVVGSGDGQQAGANDYFVGIARVGAWALMVEDNGTLGTTDTLVVPLSAGTTLISHYRKADGHGRLLFLADREVRLDFDPTDPKKLGGSGAGALAPVIDAAGFGDAETMRPTEDPARYRTYCMEAAFALTERLTGVPMTLDLLTTMTYRLTRVPGTRRDPG